MIKSLILAIQLIFLYMIVTLVIPGVNGMDHAWSLIQYVIVYPTEYMFTFFHEIGETIRTADWSANNPLEDFIGLVLLASCTLISLAIPVLYFGFWVVLVIMAIPGAWNSPPESSNMDHLLAGRTTIQDTFDAEVQANEIAKALNK